ncbi:MAG: CRTAC1 family protein [Planctomycetota bacterium]
MTKPIESRARQSIAVICALLACCGCDRAATPVAPPPPTTRLFDDVAVARGIDFVHYNGFTGNRYILEITGSGGGFLDYDLDGDLDIFLVNGAVLPGAEPPAALPRNALYRNDGARGFTDVTDSAGVGPVTDGKLRYGMGVATGDIDNDGDVDLYVTNFGDNILYRNRGDGRFEDITLSAHAAGPKWSSSAAFFDYDRDGDLDLFICGYLDFDPATAKPCRIGQLHIYCGPSSFAGIPDRLLRNDGTGVFTDVSDECGVVDSNGKGLGVVPGDFDNDGDIDFYVANDGTPNFLYINDGAREHGRFHEEAEARFAAYSEDGRAFAGMGTDFGDFDSDGDLDIVVTNLDAQTNSMYRNELEFGTTESSHAVGLGASTLQDVGFGACFLDFDLDGDLDLFFANGHVMDNVAEFRPGATCAQDDKLFENRGGKFVEVLAARPANERLPRRVGRGAACGDVDNDGDVDLLVTNNNDRPFLLLNDARSRGAAAVGLLLEGAPPASNRDAIGARVIATVGGQRMLREVKTAYSYLACHDPRLLFGVPPSTTRVDFEIRWPSGTMERLTLEPGAYHHILEGRGVKESRPFAR